MQKKISPEESWICHDTADAFVLFLQHSKKTIEQGAHSVEDEVSQEEEASAIYGNHDLKLNIGWSQCYTHFLSSLHACFW